MSRRSVDAASAETYPAGLAGTLGFGRELDRDRPPAGSNARPDPRALRPDDGPRRRHRRRCSRSARTSGATCRAGWGIALVHRRVRRACSGSAVAVARSEQLAIGLLFGFGVLMGLAIAPTIAYYVEHEPAGRLAGGRRDRALHRRLRRRRLRDPARPLGARARVLLGADRADRVRDRHDLRATSRTAS